MQKIAVLGLGLNGMISSILSKSAGFDVTIFEGENLDKYKQDSRTSVLTFESIEFFKTLGIFENLQKHLSPIFHIYTFEGEKSPILSLDAEDVSSNPFGFVIHNFNLKKVLLEYIKELDIKIVNKKVEEYSCSTSFVNLNCDGMQYEFKLILNCGGGGFAKKTFKMPYNQQAFVFNISHAENHRSIAVESFAPQGPLAVLPLLHQNQSAIIWSLHNQSANFLKQSSSDAFLKHFKFAMQRMGHIGDVKSITSDIKTYPLSLSFNKSQVKEREILLGDAFNSIHPVAGSSFNMSIKDMKNLHNHLQKSLKLGLDIGSFHELTNFARSNLKHHAEMNLFTHSLVKIFSTPSPLIKTIRSIGVEVIESVTPFKKFLMKKASGI